MEDLISGSECAFSKYEAAVVMLLKRFHAKKWQMQRPIKQGYQSLNPQTHKGFQEDTKPRWQEREQPELHILRKTGTMEEAIQKTVMGSWAPASHPDLFSGGGMRAPLAFHLLNPLLIPIKAISIGTSLEGLPESIQGPDGFDLSWRCRFPTDSVVQPDGWPEETLQSAEPKWN